MKRSVKITVAAGIIITCAVFLNTGIIGAWPPVLIWIMPTTSMEPRIEAGDAYTIDRTVPFHEVEVGDVAVYWRGHIRIAHEVVDRSDDSLIARGLNPPQAPEEYVSSDRYVGTVVDVYEIWVFNALLDHMPLDGLLQPPNNILLIVIVWLPVVFYMATSKLKSRSKGDAPV